MLERRGAGERSGAAGGRVRRDPAVLVDLLLTPVGSAAASQAPLAARAVRTSALL